MNILQMLPLWRQRQNDRDRLQLALLGAHAEVQRTQAAALAALHVAASKFHLEAWYTAALSEHRKRVILTPSPQGVD